MRRRALQMTMGAVAVAVVLLGIPLGGAWMVLAFRTTLAPDDRAQVVLTVVLTVIILTLVALAAAYAVAAAASRRISSPLIYLAAEAEQLGSGQVRPRLRSSGIEEIDLVLSPADSVTYKIKMEPSPEMATSSSLMACMVPSGPYGG